MSIVLDTQGGDNPPAELIRGGLLAADEYGVDVIFSGDESVIKPNLPANDERFSIIHAPEVITMEDTPAETVRRKKNSSVVQGIKAVRQGKAQAFVSPANTGAVMAASLFGLGRMKGIERPGIAMALPTTNKDSQVVGIDMGANTDSSAENLFQFAIMGRVYAHRVLGIEEPTIALVNIGSELHKGNDLVKQARALLETLPGFVGNIEPNRLFDGEVNVAVCDGFIGNILLKAAEGGVAVTTSALRRALTHRSIYKLGAAVMRPALRMFRDEMSLSRFGGAPLLGVRGISIVTHGNSDAEGIKHAIRVAKDAIDCDLLNRIESRIAEHVTEGVFAETK